MRLVAYSTGQSRLKIVPAQTRRAWMDLSTNRFAYRCLPLTMANGHGWELTSPATFEVLWTGGNAPAATQLVTLEGELDDLVSSHFGDGVLTFHPGYLFRTDPDYDLYVSGPANTPKDGIVSLTGIVETNWLPFTFTMNWLFTRVGMPVRFEKDEPICQIFPVPKAIVEQVDPEIRNISDDPELHAKYVAWRDSREKFNNGLQTGDPGTRQEGWQRFYNRGTTAEAVPSASGHRTRYVVKSFVDLTAAPLELATTKR